jgi:hypothetical protein
MDFTLTDLSTSGVHQSMMSGNTFILKASLDGRCKLNQRETRPLINS